MTDLRNLVRGAVISTMLMHTITGFAADEGSVDEPLSDDDRAAEFICSYTVGETSFGTFQKDFTGYFTRAQAMNPGSGPGVLLKPLKWEKSVNPLPRRATC